MGGLADLLPIYQNSLRDMRVMSENLNATILKYDGKKYLLFDSIHTHTHTLYIEYMIK